MTKKYTFAIKGIDPDLIEKKYGIAKPVLNTTSVSNVIPDTHTEHFSFVDETRQFCITMRDSITLQDIRVRFCFWCRHAVPEGVVPIGCPIRYVPNTIVKSCRSEVTKQEFTIEQTLPRDVRDIPEGKRMSVFQNDYYETDGGFCSFNCCMAFINDNTHNPMYKNSKHLLQRMHFEIFGKFGKKIHSAPSWRLLRDYGGDLTIEEFRNTFLRHLFVPTGYSVPRIPKMHSFGNIYEKIYTFLL